MSETAYTVTGMTCDHCVQAVSAEVAKLTGVTDVDVDLASGGVRVAHEQPLDDAAVRGAVEAVGYEIAR